MAWFLFYSRKIKYHARFSNGTKIVYTIAMIFLYYGNDRTKSRAKAREVLEIMHKKRPDAELITLTSENWQDGALNEIVGAQGLFEKKYMVLCDNLCDKKEIKEIVFDNLKLLKESDNAFVIIENTLDAKGNEKLVGFAEKSQEFSEVKKIQEQFNIFSLAEALGKKDKKSLWVLYSKALMKNISPEEMHGILFWQVKTMLLATKAGSAVEADLKPFVYSKAKSYLKNYSEKELVSISSNLVSLYHDARRGKGELETNLEKFILKI